MTSNKLLNFLNIKFGRDLINDFPKLLGERYLLSPAPTVGIALMTLCPPITIATLFGFIITHHFLGGTRQKRLLTRNYTDKKKAAINATSKGTLFHVDPHFWHAPKAALQRQQTKSQPV
ncbi:hypothetical protein ACTHPF_05855 [Paenibacillus sp. SAF-054]|uniref:hypothetical protein n=1 Tax=unclassified Paenibacillus TaxID=185978 RepID=UPI003F7F9660